MSARLQNDGTMQWDYGKLRSSHLWVAWVLLAAGILAVPLAWLLRNQITLGRAPLPSWSVLLVGVLVAVIGLSVSVVLLRARSRPAKRITIDGGKLSLPGGLLTGRAWSLRVSELQVRTTDLGFVKQLQLSGPRTRTTLSSAMFADDDEFQRLVDVLSNRSGVADSKSI